MRLSVLIISLVLCSVLYGGQQDTTTNKKAVIRFCFEKELPVDIKSAGFIDNGANKNKLCWISLEQEILFYNHKGKCIREIKLNDGEVLGGVSENGKYFAIVKENLMMSQPCYEYDDCYGPYFFLRLVNEKGGRVFQSDSARRHFNITNDAKYVVSWFRGYFWGPYIDFYVDAKLTKHLWHNQEKGIGGMPYYFRNNGKICTVCRDTIYFWGHDGAIETEIKVQGDYYDIISDFVDTLQINNLICIRSNVKTPFPREREIVTIDNTGNEQIIGVLHDGSSKYYLNDCTLVTLNRVTEDTFKLVSFDLIENRIKLSRDIAINNPITLGMFCENIVIITNNRTNNVNVTILDPNGMLLTCDTLPRTKDKHIYGEKTFYYDKSIQIAPNGEWLLMPSNLGFSLYNISIQ